MPHRIVDLRCPSCDARLHDQLCRREETLPCPTCSTVMVVYYPTHAARPRTADAFVPVTAGGVTYNTRSEFDAFVKRMARQTGDPHFGDKLVGHTQRSRREAMDEHLDATVHDYRAQGMDAHAAAQRIERIYAWRPR